MNNSSPTLQSYSTADLKNSSGKFRTQSLFWEYRIPETASYFTIKDEDHVVDGILYQSLKKLYMSYDHVPGYEYEFATEVLGGWLHWQTICNNKLFKKMTDLWKEELSVKLMAQGVKSLIHVSLTEGAKGMNASKWLAEKGWKPSSKGRPSKEEVERNAREQASALADLDEDTQRLFPELSIVRSS